MEVATNYISLGYRVGNVLAACYLSKSSFYYKPKQGKQGRLPYAKVRNRNGEEVSDEQIVNEISILFNKEFVDYGSFKTYKHLTNVERYQISKHKVYSIMRDNSFLRKRYKSSSKHNKLKRVKDLLPVTKGPFTYFEIDIKFVWINGKRKNAQMLTIIDVETRIVLGQLTNFKMTAKDVIDLFTQALNQYQLPEHFIVRSDNGSQFIAHKVQNFLQQRGVEQEFIKPATPQQDAHIEAYHSIFESAVCSRFVFDDLKDCKSTVERFVNFYNFERIHSGTNYTSPYLNFLQMEEEINSSPQVKHVSCFLNQMYQNYCLNNQVVN